MSTSASTSLTPVSTQQALGAALPPKSPRHGSRSQRDESPNQEIRSAILSDTEIRSEMERGNIVCVNLETNAKPTIGTNSIDVTLGRYYYRLAKGLNVDLDNAKGMIPLYGLDKTKGGYGVLEAIDGKITLAPGETILGHTQEFIGGRNHITTIMKARSSSARVGIAVCKDAGAGDVGYINRWCMQIQNTSQNTITISVGFRIAQILFLYCANSSKSYTLNGQYQKSDNIEETMNDWSPESMIPSAVIKALLA
jgi:dCTP deaminase